MVFETDQRQQRLKRKRKWPKWLRSRTLLKWAFYIGWLAFRLWRFWHALSDDPDS